MPITRTIVRDGTPKGVDAVSGEREDLMWAARMQERRLSAGLLAEAQSQGDSEFGRALIQANLPDYILVVALSMAPGGANGQFIPVA